MAILKWKDKLTIWVGEMSRAQALQFSQQAELITLVADFEFLSREVEFLFVSAAPCRVKYQDQLLADGIHEILVNPNEPPILLTLPMTRKCFDELPVSLSNEWYKAAEAENQYMAGFFLEALRKIERRSNGKLPASELS